MVMRWIFGPVLTGRCALRAQSRRASSLLELLVVIAMIALLFGMLLPSVKRSIRIASSTVCKHNLREIGHLLQLYRVEHDGWLPVGDVAAAPPSLTATSASDSNPDEFQVPNVWFMKLYPIYMTDPLVLACPQDPYRYRMIQARNHLLGPGIEDYPSYGINSFMMTAGDGMLANVDRYEPSRPLDTILVADLGPDRFTGRVKGNRLPGPSRNESMLAWDDGFDIFEGKGNPWLTTRHGHGINMLTLGGGVREPNTSDVINTSIANFYPDCAAGGCVLCRELRTLHYSFASQRLYWWTGRLPQLPASQSGS